MGLDQGEVAEYLLQRGVLHARAIVDGTFRVDDASRLNRVFVVTADPGPGYVLKVADPDDPGRIAREAAVLERLHAAGTLGAWLPRLVDFDRTRGVLILEAARDARDLDRCQATGRYSLTLARECGRALAALHQLPPELTADLALETRPVHAVLVEDLELTQLRALSGAGVEVVRAIQTDDRLGAELAALVAEAASLATIHGDVRWANCLGVGGVRRTRVCLIDWEFAAPGDPAADVGAFFGEYLRTWLADVTQVTAAAAARSRTRLEQLAPPVAAFWMAYREHADEPMRLLRRAVRHAGVRLIQAALEEAQQRDEWNSRLADTVRFGASVVRRPDEAGAQLLGLRAAWAR